MSTSDRDGAMGFAPGAVHDVRTGGRTSTLNEVRSAIIDSADRTWLGLLVRNHTGLNVNIVTAYTDTGRADTLHVSVVTANAKVHQITFASRDVAKRNKAEIYNALELAGFPPVLPLITPAEAIAQAEAAFADVPEGPFCKACGELVSRHCAQSVEPGRVICTLW